MKLVALCGLLLAGCTGPGTPIAPPATTSPPIAAPSTRTAPASPVASLLDVTCSQAIANHPTPDTAAPVLDAVSLPVGTTLAITHHPRPGWLAVKHPLGIRATAAVEVQVAPAAADRARIGWGLPGAMVTHLRTVPCAHTSGWLFYPGGYEVTAPMCVPLLVRAGGRETQVGIGIGAACPPG